MVPSRAVVFGAAVLLLSFGLAVAARGALGVERGLRSEYFTTLDGSGTPVRTSIAQQVSSTRIAADWDDAPPSTLRARWFGYIAISSADEYTFATSSNGRSSVVIDGTVVVDNRGEDARAHVIGRTGLDRGLHLVVVDLAVDRRTPAIEWLWARGDRELAHVPAWVLSPDHIDLWRITTARGIEWLPLVILGLLMLTVILEVARRGTMPSFVVERPRTASLVFFVLLAIVETWPIASDPGRYSRNDNSDTLLNEWAIAWVAHQAPRAPLEIFNGNIFHPERHTLAYSEAMIVQSAMAAPLLWLGASPVLAYNIVLIAGFALTGWAACLVMVRWTGHWTAAIVSGILLGINAHTLTRLPHLQAQHVEFLPLALVALDRLLAEPRMGHAIKLAILFVLQALTSVYLLVFSAFALLAAAVSRPEDWWGRRFPAFAWRVAVAAVVAALLLAPFMLPYWWAHTEQGMTRSLSDAARYSASLSDYLSTPARVHYAWWSYRFFPGSTALFPGFTGAALAAFALASGVGVRDRRARMCVAIGVCGVLFSMGVRLPGYTWLWEHLPLLQAIRAPVRFGYLAIVAVAFLAGYGLIQVQQRVSPPIYRGLAAIVILLVAAEPFTAPLYVTPFEGVPAIYAELRDEPRAVVAELPFWREGHRHARYMLNATSHWKPTVNGYSGFAPNSFYENRDVLITFPDTAAIARLQQIGVTHVFVHEESYSEEAREVIAHAPELQKIADDGTITLYKVLGVSP